MTRNGILCLGPLRCSPCIQPSLPGRQKPCCFSQPYVIWIPFPDLVLLAGESAWGLDPTVHRGTPSATEISLPHFSCHLHQPSQPSRAFSIVPTSHIVVMWLLPSVYEYKASLQLVFSWLFRMIFFYNLVVIPV